MGERVEDFEAGFAIDELNCVEFLGGCRQSKSDSFGSAGKEKWFWDLIERGLAIGVGGVGEELESFFLISAERLALVWKLRWKTNQ